MNPRNGVARRDATARNARRGRCYKQHLDFYSMPDALITPTAARYALPLREGGSLPALVETDDGDLFVVKFRGAGQGARALLAELIVGRIAQHLGLPVPELAVVHLDEGFGRTEPDPEIQDILRGSRGPNVGLRYLDGAFTYDPVAVADLVAPERAAEIVWLDALVTNIDRTPRNPNLLVWEDGLWLIDHGAALYFHHDWPSVDAAKARLPFAPIRDHVLLPRAESIGAADERLAPVLSEDVLRAVCAEVPDDLLMDAPEGRTPPFDSPDANRQAYLGYFRTRLAGPRAFAAEAERARRAVQSSKPKLLGYRR